MDAKEIETKQDELLTNESNDLNTNVRLKCVICGEPKKKLYLCEYDGCKQNNRPICKTCGKFTHKVKNDDNDDSSDDDDNDDETDNKKELCDHAFDTKKEYIRKLDVPTYQLSLSKADKQQIQETTASMNAMIQGMKSKQADSDRIGFELGATYSFNSVILLDGVKNYVKNPVYWSKWSAELLTLMRTGDVKQSVTKISSALFGIGDRAFEYTSVCKEGAFASGAIVFACETAYHTYHLFKGNYTMKQYKQKVITAAAVTAGSVVGNIGGAAVGAVIGTYLCPFVGTAVCSAIGGLFGGIYVGMQAKQSMDSMYENNRDENEIENEKQKIQILNEALIAFGFEKDDMNNKEIFNAAAIGKEYRRLAKKAHPDCPGGSEHKFLVLTTRMTALLAFVDQNTSVKKQTVKKIMAIEMNISQ